MEKCENGQKHSDGYYNPGNASGFKTSISPAGRVGHLSGGETNMSVPKPARDADIRTTTHSAGPRVAGEISSGDDR